MPFSGDVVTQIGHVPIKCLKSIVEHKKKLELKPANFHQASIYAWNAFRESKTITSVKYDTKRGLYAVAA